MYQIAIMFLVNQFTSERVLFYSRSQMMENIHLNDRDLNTWHVSIQKQIIITGSSPDQKLRNSYLSKVLESLHDHYRHVE